MTAGIWYHRRGSTLPMNPGSRAQGAIKVWGGLSMNRPLPPSLSPSEGERVPGGRVRGVVHGPNACEKRKGAFHEPPLSRPSATLSPPCGERAGRGVPIWFMVPMRAQKRKEAFHEPRSSRREEAHFSNAECGVRNAELSQSLFKSISDGMIGERFEVRAAGCGGS